MRIPDYPAPDRALDGTELLPIWEGQQRAIPLQSLWSLAAAQNPAFKGDSDGWLLSPLTRLALAAIAGPTSGQSAYLAEDGRQGIFVFSTTNLASAVTADTGQGIYVAPASDTTGASGAWVRHPGIDTWRYAKWWGVKADGVTDDTAAVQAALNMLRFGNTLVIPGGKIKISSTVTYGNGTASALSTIANNCIVIWGGEASNLNALTDTSDPWYSTAQSGTQFIWAGAAGGTMFQVNGPIQGLRWIGAPTFNGGCVSSGASGAGHCFEAYSFSSCTFDNIVAVNWQAGGRGVLLSTVNSTGIGGNGNPVLSGGNEIGRILASSPYGDNGECVRITGYEVAGGPDFTVGDIGAIVCGISGTGGKGVCLGYVDDLTIGKIVNTCFGSISGSPSGLYLDATTVPFPAPARVYIHHASVGQGLTAGGSTSAQVVIEYFELDDAATLPAIPGLEIRNICKTGSAYDLMAYPFDGQFKSRAVANGDGYFGKDLLGVYQHSLTRQGSNAHLAGYANIEFEAGVHSAPSTAAHFNVTPTGTGYPVGNGGTVTQATNKSTAVTLNKVCGAITLNGAALAANTVVSFALTNSMIAADDDVRVWVKSGNASVGSYRVAAEGNGAGSRTIVVENKTAGSLSEAIVLGFNVLKTAIS